MPNDPSWADSLHSAIRRRYGRNASEIVVNPGDFRTVKIHTDRLTDILYMRSDITTIGKLRRVLHRDDLLWVSAANIAGTMWDAWIKLDADKEAPEQPSIEIRTETGAKILKAALATKDGASEIHVVTLLADIAIAEATAPETPPQHRPARNGYEEEDVPLPEEKEKPVIFHLNWSDMLLKALEAIDYRFRFNVRAERPEIQYQYDPDPQWVHFTGNLQKKIRCIMRDDLLTRDARAKDKTRPLTWNNEVWSVALGAACERVGVDPVCVYLDRLPMWDGTQRIDTLFTEVFGSAATAINRHAAWVLIGGLVRRARKPGCKLDNCILLYGPKGNGKSTFLQYLIPEHLREEGYNGGMRWLDNNQRMTESTLGMWLGEWSELRGINRANSEAIKQWFSLGSDKVRLVWRTDPETFHRRFVIAGSTNNPVPIPQDETGESRRFVVVPTKKHLTRDRLIEYLDAHRDQLYAEAIARLKAGEIPAFYGEIEKAAIRDSRNYVWGDYDLESGLDALLNDEDVLLRLRGKYGMEWHEIKERVLFSSDATRVKPAILQRAIRARGLYQHRLRVDGKRTRRWFLDPPSGQ